MENQPSGTQGGAMNMQNAEDPVDIRPGTSKYNNTDGNRNQTMMASAAGGEGSTVRNDDSDGTNAESISMHSIESFVCRICHNNENPDKLVSPCYCKGSLCYVHVYCLERWISLSRCTVCELCQFHYNTQETLRYSFFESLRIWYSRSISRRALQEDCQMFSLLTLVAFGIIGTLLVAVQYYIIQGNMTSMGRLWTKSWLIFFLLTTLLVYSVNVYMIAKSQLTPWYRWWQASRDIRLVLENRHPLRHKQRLSVNKTAPNSLANRDTLNEVAIIRQPRSTLYANAPTIHQLPAQQQQLGQQPIVNTREELGPQQQQQQQQQQEVQPQMQMPDYPLAEDLNVMDHMHCFLNRNCNNTVCSNMADCNKDVVVNETVMPSLAFKTHSNTSLQHKLHNNGNSSSTSALIDTVIASTATVIPIPTTTSFTTLTNTADNNLSPTSTALVTANPSSISLRSNKSGATAIDL